MSERCATLPYLRLISYDREWKGITPSMAGNGPRLLWLRATTDYSINPQQRAWAALGIGTHAKLAVHIYNVLAEEALSDTLIRGIPDVLEEDEWEDGKYILTDYKTYGSYKLCKCLGITRIDIPVLDKDKNPLVFKTGPKKGAFKTKKQTITKASDVDLFSEELQQNNYRMLFEKYGFPISKMRLQVIPRDGSTFIATGRGITDNIYMIPINRLPNDYVSIYYARLRREVAEAFEAGKARLCNDRENWRGNRCKEEACEVYKVCRKMGG